jgi:hypothetical protein
LANPYLKMLWERWGTGGYNLVLIQVRKAAREAHVHYKHHCCCVVVVVMVKVAAAPVLVVAFNAI